MKRPKGYLSKATKRLRSKRKIKISDHIKHFNVGDKVIIKQKAYYKGALPHPRYRNIVGTVIEKRGRSYVVLIKDKNKEKKIISDPVHLESLNQ
jgi:ribosomal protein L21E